MNINRYGTTYRNGILLTKFRVSYVKITLTKGILGDPHLTRNLLVVLEKTGHGDVSLVGDVDLG
jgi:hypothetical protein